MIVSRKGFINLNEKFKYATELVLRIRGAMLTVRELMLDSL